MRILLLNPNMTQAVTDLMMEAGRDVAAAGTELVPMTAPRGVPYISTRTEAQIGGVVTLEMLAEQTGPIDAAIVAAFGDPGVAAARELFDFPIVGVSEAAMLTACLLGRSFAVISFSARFAGWYQDCIDLNGMTASCRGIHALGLTIEEVSGELPEREDALVPHIAAVAKSSGADSLIFGGAPLAGMARRLREKLPLPVVDPVGAAVKQAEALVSLRVRKAEMGTYRRPEAKAATGVSDLLAARIAHRDSAPE